MLYPLSYGSIFGGTRRNRTFISWASTKRGHQHHYSSKVSKTESRKSLCVSKLSVSCPCSGSTKLNGQLNCGGNIFGTVVMPFARIYLLSNCHKLGTPGGTRTRKTHLLRMICYSYYIARANSSNTIAVGIDGFSPQHRYFT
jgi:hypothetical protein